MKRYWLLASLMTVILPSLAGTINVSGGGNALQKAIAKAKSGDVLLVEPGTYSAIDTQGKEIEIRSTKGPKQTFLTTGSFSKNFGVKWGIGRNVKFAALLVSDVNTEIWSEEYDDVYPSEVQWSEWDATQLPHSTLVGFTIQGRAISVNDCFTVNGGRIVNCILTDASIHAAEAEGCLIVCPTRNDGELVCDSRLMNCTVVVGGASRCGEEIYCSELINTIVYALNGEVEIAWSCIIQPRMLNSVCYNIRRFSSEGHPMDLSGIRESDPMFVDRTTGDYRLTAASPCVDKGANELSISDTDLNGGARIVNGTVDIGAYEYGSTPVYEESSAIEPSYGPFVAGEKVSLSIPALVGYTAKGLPSGLKLDKKTGEITGAAKKPTGEAGVTVTFTKKNEPTLTAQFVVGPVPTINVTLEGDTEKCKVTGANKAYLVGKKVSLSAKGPRGTAFVGWFKDGEPWPNAEESKNAKLSYVMTKESLALVARFEKEKMRVACPVFAASSFTVGVAGGAAGIPIEIETQSGVKSVAVSKLPSGMKYDKKTGLIVGVPTKAGSFNVTIRVTAKSGAVETLVVPVTVAALPDWAVGTFVGLVRQVDYDARGNVVVDGDGRHDWYDGELTVTVSAKGKISGKLKLPDAGGTGSFAFPAFASCDEGGCIASGSMKLGKSLKMDVELQIRERTLTEGASNLAGDLEIRMRGTEDSLTVVFSTDENRPLRQQVWKSKTLPLPPSIDKKSVALEQDGLLYTLCFGKSGAVSDVLASADNPKKAIVKGKPVFSVVGYWDAAWHCELFGTPVVDMADGGEERLCFDVRITDDGSLICTRSEKTF